MDYALKTTETAGARQTLASGGRALTPSAA